MRQCENTNERGENVSTTSEDLLIDCDVFNSVTFDSDLHYNSVTEIAFLHSRIYSQMFSNSDVCLKHL